MSLAPLIAITLLGASAPAAGAKLGWTVQPTPNPAGTVSDYFSGVSCTSVKSCTAVGYASKMAVLGVPLAEHWNGSKWAIDKAPSPPGVSHAYFNGISCPAARVCVAVGYSALSSGQEYTLAERWNGSKWTIQATRNPHGAVEDYLSGVSCTSANACIAVGYYSARVAVGTSFAERWDGQHWTLRRLPSPAGATHTYAYGIACLSSKACTAVGQFTTASNTESTLAEHWDGTRWTIQHTPNPLHATDSYLAGVSCTSSSQCLAVGATSTGPNETPLAERLNGKHWTMLHPPTPAKAATSYLSGVSCGSAKACTAVGYYSPSRQVGAAFADRWTGTGWTLQHTARPATATHTYLAGVWCISARDCTAAGDFDNTHGTELTLAERWRG